MPKSDRMNFWSRFPDVEYFATMDADPVTQIRNVNAHIHSPYSFSAFNSIDHALSLAKDEDVRVVGINDFYSTGGFAEWAEACMKYKIFPLFNIEFVGLSQAEQEKGIRINDPNNPGRIYISGKGLRFPMNLGEPWLSRLEGVKNNANQQTEEMCLALNRHLASVEVDIRISFDEVTEQLTMGLVRERHLAKALRMKVLEKATDNEEAVSMFKRILGSGEVKSDLRNYAALENEIRGKLLKAGGAAFIPESPDQFLALEEIRQVILKSGGIPTYPLLADSVEGGFTEFENDKEKLLITLINKGFYSVEFITNRNTTAILEEYASFFIEKGFLVTFGSEHNTPELIPLELKNVKGEYLTKKLKVINFKNACVLAAHQYLLARTGTGYLNDNGIPDSENTDDFVKLGARLIDYFYSN